jgi:hypothetical protein
LGMNFLEVNRSAVRLNGLNNRLHGYLDVP